MKNALMCLCLLAGLAAPAAAATLSIVAAPTAAKVGDIIVVDVVVSDAADLYAFQFDLVYESPLLGAQEAVEGDLLNAAGAPTTFFAGLVDDAAGSVSFIAGTRLGPGPGASGDGALARLSLLALAPGQGSLSLRNVVLLDSTLAETAVTLGSSTALSVTAVPEPASAALLLAGLAALAGATRRRPA